MIEFITPTAGDTDAIVKIEVECFGAGAWSRASVEEFIKNEYSHVIAAVADGEIVGYAGTFIICDEAEVSNIAVLPSHRRRGIAKDMLHRLYELARSHAAKRILLEVREGNLAARALYEAEDFTVDGVRRGYYSSPREDAVLMTKIL